MKTILLFFVCCFSGFSQNIRGFIREFGSKEQLVGVTVFCPENSKGATSNRYGFYSLILPNKPDSISIIFSLLG